MRPATVIVAGLMLLGAPPHAARSEQKPCYDWALVARLERQTFIGLPEVGPNEISLDAIYQWRVRVREIVIGQDVPQRLELTAVAHTALAPWAAQRVILLVAKGHGPTLRVARWGVLPRHLNPSQWHQQVMGVAEASGLSRCS
jgi:hypothetical protein